jgi:flagella basal body P-ring formation protein FlgA
MSSSKTSCIPFFSRMDHSLPDPCDTGTEACGVSLPLLRTSFRLFFPHSPASVLAVLLAIVTAAPAAENVRVIFRDSALVTSGQIRLQDIARFRGGNGGLHQSLCRLPVGESAPPGYARFVNSRDVLFRILKPRFPDQAFVPVNEGRIRVRTDSRSGTLGDFRSTIETYLQDRLQWPASDWTCQILDSSRTWRCLNRPYSVTVDGLEDAHAKGTVRLTVVLRQDSLETRVPVTCEIRVTTPVLIAADRIERGATLSPDNVRLERRDITYLRSSPLTDMNALREMSALRTITAGTPVTRLYLRKAPAVDKNDLVHIALAAGSIRISVPARARESGSIGERIWVQNIKTNKLVRVTVTGKGMVAIETGERI